MKKRTSYPIFVTVSLLSLFLALGAAGGDGSEELPKAIEAANAEFMARFAAGSGAGVAELYTEDGQLLPPNSEPISGRAAIAEFWQNAIDTGLTGVKLKGSEVEGSGDVASEVGRYSLTDAEGNSLDQGKYIVLWKNVGGEWKLHRDIWNSNNLPPVAGDAQD